jgi:NAD(P)-dependent dehydrogenase (short-subunit alcohol dehydrogenase family)
MNADPLFGIDGKVIAITGAAGVIYRRISEALASRGAHIALLDIARVKRDDPASPLAAEATAESIRKAGGSAIALHCNVLDRESVQETLGVITEGLGKVDVLINGAGGNQGAATAQKDQRFTDLESDALRSVVNLNLMGTVIPCQVFCPHFAKNGQGLIINTSSMCAFTPLTNIPGYSAAKAAVTNLTRWLASQVRVDFPGTAIRVNEIAPGFLITDQNRNLLLKPDGSLTPRAESVIRRTPMERFGEPDELVGALIFLMSKAGSFVHGATIPIDGGFSACSGVGPLNEKDVLFAQAKTSP